MPSFLYETCWLETVPNCIRSSPVLVQYIVNYLSDTPIKLRKTPKLYSDTRSVAHALLRSDSPVQTVAKFVETGETDPREIEKKKQATINGILIANSQDNCEALEAEYISDLQDLHNVVIMNLI
ncbi:unnamed protein product [Caenorhabditis nigoni]